MKKFLQRLGVLGVLAAGVGAMTVAPATAGGSVRPLTYRASFAFSEAGEADCQREGYFGKYIGQQWDDYECYTVNGVWVRATELWVHYTR